MEIIGRPNPFVISYNMSSYILFDILYYILLIKRCGREIEFHTYYNRKKIISPFLTLESNTESSFTSIIVPIHDT